MVGVGANESEDIYSFIRQNNLLAIRLWLDNVMNDIHQSDEHGFTLLHWAAWYGRHSVVHSLIERGARVNAVNRADDTPLHIAVSHNHFDIVQQLMNNGAQVNVANIHGNTPLHYACFHRYVSIANQLIEQGNASLYVANRYGQTPLDVCISDHLRRTLEDLAMKYGQNRTVVRFQEHLPLVTASVLDTSVSLPKQSLVDVRELQFQQCVRSNHREEVWQTVYQDSMVIAKVFKLRHDLYSASTYQHEIEKIRSLNSPYLLVPFAICHDAPNFIVLTSFKRRYQTLFHLLHKTEIAAPLTLLLKLILDIGRGMSYLHGLANSFRPQFVLNSDHVTVTEDFLGQLNLSDCYFSFESSVEFDKPAWIAPEVLETGTLKDAGDIWSFAIILWECMMRQIPFSDLTPMECGLKIVRDHLRLPITGISNHVDKIIQLCTHDDPDKRPTFDAILPILAKVSL